MLTPTTKIQLAKEPHKAKRGNKCNNGVRFNCKQKGYTPCKSTLERNNGMKIDYKEKNTMCKKAMKALNEGDPIAFHNDVLKNHCIAL